MRIPIPGNPIKPTDDFYVERGSDVDFRRSLRLIGNVVTIRGDHQTGKTSMLLRGLNFVKNQGAKVIYLDFQSISNEVIQDPKRFYLWLGHNIAKKLNLNPREFDSSMSSSLLGYQDILSEWLEDTVFEKIDRPIILAIDEADRLLSTSHYSDFFGLLRSWHIKGAYDIEWEKLNIVIAITTEPYMLIEDSTNQSPFNVGTHIYLNDFDENHLKGLNEKFHLNLSQSDIQNLLEQFGGHPYLIHQAIHFLSIKDNALTALIQIAHTDQGPFGNHLEYLLQLVSQNPELKDAVTRVLENQHVYEFDLVYKMRKMGLIKSNGGSYTFRCDLYKTFFKNWLTSAKPNVKRDLKNSRQTLRTILTKNFDSREIRDLCFDLCVDFDDLAGENKSDKARELITLMERNARLPDLITTIRNYRPNIPIEF